MENSKIVNKVKENISFSEMEAIVNKVVEDCFPGGEYTPINYELSFRTAIILAFAPDFDLSDCKNNDELWERVASKEAENILMNDISDFYYYKIEAAIQNEIDYRIKSNTVSMSDYALSKLIDVLTEKVEQIDTSALSSITNDDVEIIRQAVNSANDNSFAENLIDAMLDKGLLKNEAPKIGDKSGSK